MSRKRHNVADATGVRVMAEKCETCIFRPGNLMKLMPGRVAEMVEDARENDAGIICHATLDEPEQAVCRGFFDKHPTTPLQIAERLERIVWWAVP